MTVIKHMSAADEIAARISHLSASEKREFMTELQQKVEAEAAKADVSESRARRIAGIRAARDRARVDLTTKNSITWIDGLLKRHGAPTIEEIAMEGPARIDAMLASSAKPIPVETRMTLKTGLHALGLC
jgi:hypothetical protein